MNIFSHHLRASSHRQISRRVDSGYKIFLSLKSVIIPLGKSSSSWWKRCSVLIKIDSSLRTASNHLRNEIHLKKDFFSIFTHYFCRCFGRLFSSPDPHANISVYSPLSLAAKWNISAIIIKETSQGETRPKTKIRISLNKLCIHAV